MCWNKASEKAIFSYSKLLQKKCAKTLNKYKREELNGTELYAEVIQNMTEAADLCIPKNKPNKGNKRHDLPMWRERMTSYRTDVDYWNQVQFLQGGPNYCHPSVQQQLRMAKLRYKNQIRQLRREVEYSLAESTTKQNCHNQLFKKPKVPPPAMIDGHSRSAQPEMWREHFRQVFCAEEDPYRGDLLSQIDAKITDEAVSNFNFIKLHEMNNAIALINTNKSYKRHHHWKTLNSENHSAKLCLHEVFNYWIVNTLYNNDINFSKWDFFLTDLNLIPKSGKKDFSSRKSWRPISIGSSENWILEKIILNRLSPYVLTNTCYNLRLR